MRLLDFLTAETDLRSTRVIVMSTLAGSANAMVVVIINNVAQDFSELNFRSLLMFSLCILLYVVTKKYSLYETATTVRTAMYRANMRISDKIRRTSLMSLETIGKTQIYTTMAENTEIVYEASRKMVNGISQIVMLVFCFIYIAILSMTAFWFSIAMIGSAVLIYILNQKKISEGLRAAANKEGEYFDTMNHILEGFKEIKMNVKKSEDLLRNYLEKISRSTKELQIGTENRVIANYIFIQIFFYILLGSIVFVLPQTSSVTVKVVGQITAVILFIIGPLGNVVEAIPLILKANMSLERFDNLEKLLEDSDDMKHTAPDAILRSKETFDAITLKRVIFTYPETPAKQSFTVGPIDLTIKRGEVVFLVGGNGSGKTTLLKILTGLYYPQSGTIMVDDIAVNMTNYAYYRDLIAVIFTESHVFDRLYGIDDVDEIKLNELINMMELVDKTSYVEGKFTDIKLSTGQRKRLALIESLMENRAVYVLDEVAADQDPHFRKYFYDNILRKMQSEGKTIIAATHDDKYFYVADRVLKMDYGKITEDRHHGQHK
ncbi:MAG: cyclic peptide export ABC transporter [Nitrospirae bacterium]|nr:cyclic peptide export ABC transporter [Nitrospirota bacterium]MBF0535983.1 cyclic peptide export ABC transporter [Nitrospirota bacterium]MBF0617896.1 cyclic peptide export ABC transporter [Nitrospirota bacterium]